MIFEQIL